MDEIRGAVVKEHVGALQQPGIYKVKLTESNGVGTCFKYNNIADCQADRTKSSYHASVSGDVLTCNSNSYKIYTMDDFSGCIEIKQDSSTSDRSCENGCL